MDYRELLVAAGVLYDLTTTSANFLLPSYLRPAICYRLVKLQKERKKERKKRERYMYVCMYVYINFKDCGKWRNMTVSMSRSTNYLKLDCNISRNV